MSGDAFAVWNVAPTAEAERALLSCCGSSDWAERLTERRPFGSADALISEAEAAWFALPEQAWLQAFACHPRIGEKRAEVATTEQSAAWSGSEQGAAQATLDAVAAKLAEGNAAYEMRFGFLYIVFASGRTAPELLAVLEERLGHDRAAELQEAARQQWQITKLRMTRWLL